MKDHKLKAWGKNYYGQLGLGNTTDKYIPTEVKYFTELLKKNNSSQSKKTSIKKIIDVAVGLDHSLVVTSDYNVHSFGGNSFGQISETKSSNNSNTYNPYRGFSHDQYVPKVMDSLIGKKITRVFCGYIHSVFLSENGDLYYCGWNGRNQACQKNIRDDDKILIPVKMNVKEKVKDVSCGHSFNVILSVSNTLYVCGSINSQDFGLEKLKFGDNNIRKIQCSLGCFFVLCNSGKVYTMGSTRFLLGLKYRNYKPPKKLPSVRKKVKKIRLLKLTEVDIGAKIIDMSFGSDFGVFVSESGESFGFGSNSNHQIGKDVLIDIPFQMRKLIKESVVQVKCGFDFTFLMCRNKDIYRTGRNYYGQQLLVDKTKNNLTDFRKIKNKVLLEIFGNIQEEEVRFAHKYLKLILSSMVYYDVLVTH